MICLLAVWKKDPCNFGTDTSQIWHRVLVFFTNPNVRVGVTGILSVSAMENSTLKLKAVALLLGLHFAHPAFAIGLGNLSVHSNLGEPLYATVDVLSAPANLDTGCLSLRASDNGLPVPAYAKFRIERKGDNALLHITTPAAIYDPIAQFVLTSDCEGRLQREYVVLLDPPTQIEPVRLAEPMSTAVSLPSAANSIPSSPAATETAAEAAASNPPRHALPVPRRATRHPQNRKRRRPLRAW